MISSIETLVQLPFVSFAAFSPPVIVIMSWLTDSFPATVKFLFCKYNTFGLFGNAEAFFCLKYASESLWYEIKASACSGLSRIFPNRRIPF